MPGRRNACDSSPMHGSPVPQHTPTVHWQAAVDEMLRILRTREHLLRTDRCLLEQLLDCCPADVAVVTRVDSLGFNILQRCVMRDCHGFLCAVLERLRQRDLRRLYARPLHLACKLGHAHLVELLLNHGIDVTSSRCANSVIEKAMQVTLQHDYPGVMAALLHHADTRLNMANILKNACSEDAVRCLSFLLNRYPQQALCSFGPDCPSLLGTAFLQSERCGLVLLNSGVVWPKKALVNTSGKHEGLLHVIYRSPCCHNLVRLTQVAFRVVCRSDHLLCKDRNGNTPLHALARQVGRRARTRRRGDQIANCMHLLVVSGVDVNEKNNTGETALHQLLSEEISRIPGWQRCRSDVLPEVNRAVQLLLENGADANASGAQTAPPLAWAARLVCSMELGEVEENWSAAEHCFNLLCRHGADPAQPDEKGISAVTMFLTATNRWLTQCDNDASRGNVVLRHVERLIVTLLQHCTRPADDVMDVCSKQIAIMCNTNVVSESALLGNVCRLLAAFVSYGVDLARLPLVASPATADTSPCKLNARFYLACAFLVHQNQHEGMFNFLTLFEENLPQPSLSGFVEALCRILHVDFGCDARTGLVGRLRQRTRQPRSLAVLSRLTIRQAMRWELQKSTNSLPLPHIVQKYVMHLC